MKKKIIDRILIQNKIILTKTTKLLTSVELICHDVEDSSRNMLGIFK